MRLIIFAMLIIISLYDDDIAFIEFITLIFDIYIII